MADDLEIAVALVCSFYLLLLSHSINNIASIRKRKHRCWVKPWICERTMKGAYSSLLNDLANTDRESFTNYMRMDLPAFEDLLALIESKIVHSDTRMRCSVPPRERLCVAIRYLATGLYIAPTIYRSLDGLHQLSTCLFVTFYWSIVHSFL